MKTCTRCGNPRKPDDFHNHTLPDGRVVRRNVCKFCRSKTVFKSMEKKRDWYNQKSCDESKERRVANKLRVIEYLLLHPCIDCEQKNPLLLDFDHIDRSTKRKHISAMLNKYSWESILAEIAKCIVRCAYCHRIHTAKQLGYLNYVKPEFFEITWKHSS